MLTRKIRCSKTENRIFENNVIFCMLHHEKKMAGLIIVKLGM